MKNRLHFSVALLFFAHCFLIGNLYGQKGELEASKHSLLHEVVVQEFDFINKSVTSEKMVVFPNVVFETVQRINIDDVNYTVVKPVKIIVKKKKKIEENVDGQPKFKRVKLHRYYLIRNMDMENNLQDYTPKTWKMRVGAIGIPVKLYMPRDNHPLDFSFSNFSFGSTLGVAHQISESKSNLWINYLFSLSMTTVVRGQGDFEGSNSVDRNPLAALSPALGIALNFKGAEFGLFAGKDFLPGTAADSWIYNGETWFSFTFGAVFTQGGGDQTA